MATARRYCHASSQDGPEVLGAFVFPSRSSASSQHSQRYAYAWWHQAVTWFWHLRVTCYHPLKGYRSREVNPSTGKHGITFSATKSLIEGSIIAIPCGQCVGCRLDRAKAWAVRCHHESKMHPQNCFVTLTYDDQHVPVDYSVKLRDFQLFMKRLRFKVGSKVRYFACGEYGERTLRPHYHSLIFNYDFPDKKILTVRREFPVYSSKILKELWPYGSHEIGSVRFQSAGYIARYCLKKINGNLADDHYWRVSPIDGRSYRVAPEFAVMSRRPGIGTSWFKKFADDAFPSDFLIVDGRRVRVPNFYLNMIEEDEALVVKRKRKRKALKHRENNTKERLEVREEAQELKVKLLKREV